jgi:hypothetical protein
MAANLKLAYWGTNPLTQKPCAYTLNDDGTEVMIGQASNRADLISRLTLGKLNKAIKHNVVDIVDFDEFKRRQGRASANNGLAISLLRADLPVQEEEQSMEQPLVAFTADEKFYYFGVYTDMVLSKERRAMVVLGNPGIGKSYTVFEEIKRRGLKDLRDFTSLAKAEGKHLNQYPGDYIVFPSGEMTSRALFRILFEFNNFLIIFDDCDVLAQKKSANIAKGALNNEGKCLVTWATDMSGEAKDDDVPETFEFTGRVIMITNNDSSQIHPAILSRCLVANVWLSVDETFERMKKILSGQSSYTGKFTEQEIWDTFECMSVNRNICAQVSFRTFASAILLRRRFAEGNWQRAVQFTIQTAR